MGVAYPLADTGVAPHKLRSVDRPRAWWVADSGVRVRLWAILSALNHPTSECVGRYGRTGR